MSEYKVQTQRNMNIFDALNRLDVKLAVLTESKSKGNGNENKQKYIYFYSGVSKDNRVKAGISALINNNLKSSIKSLNKH